MNKFTMFKNIFGLVNIGQDRHLYEIWSSYDSTMKIYCLSSYDTLSGNDFPEEPSAFILMVDKCHVRKRKFKYQGRVDQGTTHIKP